VCLAELASGALGVLDVMARSFVGAKRLLLDSSRLVEVAFRPLPMGLCLPTGLVAEETRKERTGRAYVRRDEGGFGPLAILLGAAQVPLRVLQLLVGVLHVGSGRQRDDLCSAIRSRPFVEVAPGLGEEVAQEPDVLHVGEVLASHVVRGEKACKWRDPKR
jgi:hypothetical protein